MDVTALAEIEAIRRLKAHYFRFLDGKRWQEWGELFTEDALLDTTDDAPDLIRGRDTIVKAVSRAIGEALTIHHGHMPEIDLVGPGRATGIWAMEDTLEYPGDPPSLVIRGRGHYHEDYVKGADGRWRIQTLRLRRIWLEHNGVRVIPKPGQPPKRF